MARPETTTPLTDVSHPIANKTIGIAKANRIMIGVTA
jgi:hypothetical protein